MRATKSSRNLATLKGYDRMVGCRSLAAWRHGPSYELDFLGDLIHRAARIGPRIRRFVGRRHHAARYRASDDQSNCAYGMVQHYRALDYGNRVGIDAGQPESLSTWSPWMGRGRSGGTSGQSFVECAVHRALRGGDSIFHFRGAAFRKLKNVSCRRWLVEYLFDAFQFDARAAA